MSFIPKNIFFYWTGSDVPDEIKTNIENYKVINPTFDVKIITNDDFLNKAIIDFPNLVKLFSQISIPTCKSDIARLLVLYYHGGIYIDCNTGPVKSFDNFYNEHLNYDFIISFNYTNSDYSTRIMMSKPESKIIFDILNIISSNLHDQFVAEFMTDQHVLYNILILTGTGPFYELLGRANSKELFENYNMTTFDDNSDIVKHYACNMKHHHTENFHKHWSRVQLVQKLFI
jgi:hypothetical protein